MRFAILCAVLFLASCDDEEVLYADGSTWSNPSMPQLLKNDSLIRNPHLRRMPTTEQEWTRFIQTLNAQPVANVGNIVETFTPVWGNDFSVDPVGDISYYDLGAVVILWTDTPITGTSDTATFSLGGLPEKIRPIYNGYSRIIQCSLVDNNLLRLGVVYVDDSGTLTFGLAEVAGTELTANIAAFTASSLKGLTGGWLIMYSK